MKRPPLPQDSISEERLHRVNKEKAPKERFKSTAIHRPDAHKQSERIQRLMRSKYPKVRDGMAPGQFYILTKENQAFRVEVLEVDTYVFEPPIHEYEELEDVPE